MLFCEKKEAGIVSAFTNWLCFQRFYKLWEKEDCDSLDINDNGRLVDFAYSVCLVLRRIFFEVTSFINLQL